MLLDKSAGYSSLVQAGTKVADQYLDMPSSVEGWELNLFDDIADEVLDGEGEGLQRKASSSGALWMDEAPATLPSASHTAHPQSYGRSVHQVSKVA